MFKKLVTNLPYSPGLLNQVGFYAKRLQQEEFTRRLGLIFAILALLVNINLSLFSPEASVLASPANDVVTGGIYGSTAQEMQDKAINAMRNSAYTRAIFEFYGVTESDIRNTSINYINNSDPQYRSVGKQSFGRGAEVCYSNNGYRFCERSMHAAYNYRTKNVKVLQGAIASKITQSDPWFAIAESCGNIVIRVGKTEDITISKELSPNQGQNVDPGDIVSFRLKVRETSGNPAAYIRIDDTLPEHTEYVDHSPKDMFSTVQIDGRKVTLGNDAPLYGLGPNEERVIEFKVRILASAPPGARLCNSAQAVSLGDNAISNQSPCVTVNTPDPVPVCSNLRMLGAGGDNFVRTFEATVNPDGATISSYTFDFGDGQTQTISSSDSKVTTTHTYTPGSYVAKVSASTSHGDVGNSGTCLVSFIVIEPFVDPVVVCNYIRLISGSGTDKDRTFEVSGEITGSTGRGTRIEGFTMDYGDGQQQTVELVDNFPTQVTHTYANPGTYTARVTINSTLGQVTNNASCVIEVQVDPEPEVCPYDPNLLADDQLCIEPEVCIYDPALLSADEACVEPTSCPFNPALPEDDPGCVGDPNIIRLKQAENVTQGIADAHNTTAKAGDIIKYTLLTENDGEGPSVGYVIVEDMGDVFQYADLVDANGATLDADGFVLTWPAVDIQPDEVVTKTVTVKIKSPIPNTPVSASDPLAYDLRLENAYGNNVTIKLPSSTVKTVEEVVTTLPNTGPGLNAVVSTLFIGAVSYFYFRNRLISKELGLIKSEFSGGIV